MARLYSIVSMFSVFGISTVQHSRRDLWESIAVSLQLDLVESSTSPFRLLAERLRRSSRFNIPMDLAMDTRAVLQSPLMRDVIPVLFRCAAAFAVDMVFACSMSMKIMDVGKSMTTIENPSLQNRYQIVCFLWTSAELCDFGSVGAPLMKASFELIVVVCVYLTPQHSYDSNNRLRCRIVNNEGDYRLRNNGIYQNIPNASVSKKLVKARTVYEFVFYNSEKRVSEVLSQLAIDAQQKAHKQMKHQCPLNSILPTSYLMHVQ